MKSFNLKLEFQSKFRARQNMVSTLGSPHKGGQVMQLIYKTAKKEHNASSPSFNLKKIYNTLTHRSQFCTWCHFGLAKRTKYFYTDWYWFTVSRLSLYIYICLYIFM